MRVAGPTAEQQVRAAGLPADVPLLDGLQRGRGWLLEGYCITRKGEGEWIDKGLEEKTRGRVRASPRKGSMPASKYAWKTGAELAEELGRLEWRAGVRTGHAEGAPEPDASVDRHERWVRQIRAEYFRAADIELRRRMIELAIELHRRVLVELNLERLSAQRAVAAAREGEDAHLLALAIAIPFCCVGLGYLIAGVPGQIAGIVLALLLSAWAFRRHRRSVLSAVDHASRKLQRAERRVSAFESRRAPFDEKEAASGIENPGFEANASRGGQARQAVRAQGTPLWRGADGYSMP